MTPTPDRIIMDFWKFYPEIILLSEKIKDMTARQFGAYWWICCQVMIQPLPGVTLADETKLIGWGKLNKEEWGEDRGNILGSFLYHPETATLHHEFIKGLYLEQFKLKTRAKVYGSKGGQIAQHGKAKGASTPPQVSPYTHFKNTLYSLLNASPEDLDGIFTRKNKVISTPPLATLKGASTNQSINRLNTATQEPSTLAEDGSAGVDREDTPITLGKFLRNAVEKTRAT